MILSPVNWWPCCSAMSLRGCAYGGRSSRCCCGSPLPPLHVCAVLVMEPSPRGSGEAELVRPVAAQLAAVDQSVHHVADTVRHVLAGAAITHDLGGRAR